MKFKIMLIGLTGVIITGIILSSMHSITRSPLKEKNNIVKSSEDKHSVVIHKEVTTNNDTSKNEIKDQDTLKDNHKQYNSEFINNTLNLENDIVITEYNDICNRNINYMSNIIEHTPIIGKVMFDLYIAIKKESDIAKMDDLLEFISSPNAIAIENKLLPLLTDTFNNSKLKNNEEIYSELIAIIIEEDFNVQQINQELSRLLYDHGISNTPYN